MGEKGNDVGGGGVTDTVATVRAVADPSVIERVTTTTTQTIVGVGEDAMTTLKDKAIDHGADAVLDEARERLARRPDSDDPASKETTGDGDGPAAAR